MIPLIQDIKNFVFFVSFVVNVLIFFKHAYFHSLRSLRISSHIYCASPQAPAWEFSAGSSSFQKSRELELSGLGRPSWSSRLHTHLNVGRNKPVRAIARTGVSGAPIAGNTHPCCRRAGLFRPTSEPLQYSYQITVLNRLVYNDESWSLGTSAFTAFMFFVDQSPFLK
jgi:hypothetical protein